MALIKKPYEISVWEDVLNYVGKKYVLANSSYTGQRYTLTDLYILVGRMFIDDFNSNKTNYYYEENGQYIQCTSASIYDETKDYYTKKSQYLPDENGKYKLSGTTNGTNIYDFGEIYYQYYDERRIATIGSNTMTSPMRALNASLTRNINGVETLKFEMYYQYVDPNTGERVHNPLIDLLVNERKIKLYYDDDDPNHPDKWYDFIIKKDEEKARDNKYSFTCDSLAITELSKTGFNIELDNELQNNMGTVVELGKKVLDGSDWQVDSTSDIVQQTVNEALYKIKIKEEITARRYDNTPQVITSGNFIYIYYTPYNTQEKDFLQFIYIPNNKIGEIKTLSDRMTIVCDDKTAIDCYMQNVTWDGNKLSFQADINDTNFQVTNYRGDRLVRKQKTVYDPVLKKVVKEYKDNDNKTVYGYQTVTYLDAKVITNYIHNSTNFGGTSYWTTHSATESSATSIERVVYPDVSVDNATDTRASYLKVFIGKNRKDEETNITYYSFLKNDGIVYNYSKIDTFNQNETYIFRAKVGYINNNVIEYCDNTNFPFNCLIKKYKKIDELNSQDGEKYFQFYGKNAIQDDDDYIYITARCLKSASWEELKKNLGIFITRGTHYSGSKNYYIEDIQFYKGIKNKNGEYMHIGDTPEESYMVVDHYYYKEANQGKTDPEDYDYISKFYYKSVGELTQQEFNAYSSTTTLYIKDEDTNEYQAVTTYQEDTTYYIIKNFTPIYGSGAEEFEKVRSISAKESNRFNLIQSLCETFECWAKFEIAHDENNGSIAIIERDYYSPVTITESTYNRNKSKYYIYDQITKEYINCEDKEYDNTKQYYICEKRKYQDKKVIFYEETLIQNFVGFKYGINLKDVTRTLDSDQIATKIIVKNNSQSAANNGFCSIARAHDNPTKENFIYNFDYYTKQGIINKSILNNDLYMPNFLSGYIGLYPKLKSLNEERNSLIDLYTELGKRIPDYTSDKETASLTMNSAAENLEKLINPKTGTIRQYCGYIYEDFYDQVPRKKNNDNYISAYAAQIYWIENGGNLSEIKVSKKVNGEYSDTEIETFYKQINWNDIKKSVTVTINGNNSSITGLPSSHYTTITKDGVITGYKFNSHGVRYYRISDNYYHRCADGEEITTQNYYDIGYTNKTPYQIVGDDNKFKKASSALSTTGNYFLQYAKSDVQSSGHYNDNILFQTPSKNNYMKFNSNGSSTANVYIYGARKRLKDIAGYTIRDNTIIRYLEQVTTLRKEEQQATSDYEEANTTLTQAETKYKNYEEKLKDIANATDEIEKEFLLKYSRYIQEGSWIDENYMDDDLYYLDAVQVLYQSAYPKVSYNISVLELSALEGYEAYKFNIAHKTFIEDIEFFGWEDKVLNIPAREYVVVTESTVTLDEPDKNVIKVQNYRTHFEDLFQRITASTQQLQFHSGEYSRAADAVTPEGTIASAVIGRTMASASFVIQNANNQSVVIDETGLTATKISDPAQVVTLSSGGLLVSTDGGLTWGVAITGYGINTNYLSAGTIDADNINIMSGAYPTFKWDGKGLRALSFDADENGRLTSYNNSKYVTFDRFGIYGINGITDFVPSEVAQIENTAQFALTWNGLFIRNSYRKGYVSINPTEDVALYSYGNSKFKEVERTGNDINFTEELYNEDPGTYYYVNDGKYIQCTTESFDFVDSKTVYTKDTSGSVEGLTPILRGKFGLIDSTEKEEIFGLALYDQDGTLTFTSRSDGSLWLATKMEIGIPDRSTEIYLGVGDEATDAEKRFIYEKTTGRKLQPSDPLPPDYKEHGKKVIRVHGGAWEDTETETPVGGTSDIDRFTVYEDGFVIDNGNLHNGPICAPSGTIGGLSIAALPTAIGVRINSERGDTFKINSDGVVSPQQLVFSVKTTLENIRNIIWKIGIQSNNLSDVAWYSYINGQWKNGNIIIGGEDIGKVESNILYLNYKEELFSGGVMYVGLETEVSGNNIKDQITVKLSIDGSPNYSYSLVSSLGNIIEDSTLEVATNLIPYVYRNGVDISDLLYYKWYYKMNGMNDYEEMQLDVEGSGHHSGIGYILINNLPTDIPDNEHQKRYISLKLLDWDYISIYFEYSEIPSNEGGGNNE